MTDTTKTGGPAFPHQACPTVTYCGMTLRDWFAGQAPDVPWWWPSYDFHSDMEHFIAWRWAYADAMIAARGEA